MPPTDSQDDQARAAADPRAAAGILPVVAVVLSALALLVAGVAALNVIRPGGTVAADSTEPAVVVDRTATMGAQSTVTAQLSFPGLKAGGVIFTTIMGVNTDLGASSVLARSIVRVDSDGPAIVRLVAVANPDDDVTIEAKAPGRTCTVNLPSTGSPGEGANPMSCTPG